MGEAGIHLFLADGLPPLIGRCFESNTGQVFAGVTDKEPPIYSYYIVRRGKAMEIT